MQRTQTHVSQTTHSFPIANIEKLHQIKHSHKSQVDAAQTGRTSLGVYGWGGGSGAIALGGFMLRIPASLPLGCTAVAGHRMVVSVISTTTLPSRTLLPTHSCSAHASTPSTITLALRASTPNQIYHTKPSVGYTPVLTRRTSRTTAQALSKRVYQIGQGVLWVVSSICHITMAVAPSNSCAALQASGRVGICM